MVLGWFFSLCLYGLFPSLIIRGCGYRCKSKVQCSVKFFLQLFLNVNRASLNYKGHFCPLLSSLSRQVHQPWQFFIQNWTTSGKRGSNTAPDQYPMICGPSVLLCIHHLHISTATAEQDDGSSALKPSGTGSVWKVSCAAPATLKLIRNRPLSLSPLSVSLNLGKASTSGRISAGVPAERDMQILQHL